MDGYCTLLVQESFVLAAVLVGQFTMFLYNSNNTNVILCSATLYLCISGPQLFGHQGPVSWKTFFFHRPGDVSYGEQV